MNMYQSSLRQFYITQVLNVYKQKTPLHGGANSYLGYIGAFDANQINNNNAIPQTDGCGLFFA